VATEQEGIKIYMPVDLAQALKERAKAEDRTVAAIVRRLVREYLASEKVAA